MPQAWPTALQALARLVNADGGHFATWDRKAKVATFAQTAGSNNRLASQYAAEWGRRDPIRVAVEAVPPASWVLNHEAMSLREFDNNQYNNEFLFKSGYRHVAKMRSNVRADGSSYDLIGFVRVAKKDPFDRRWISEVDKLLSPHLRRVSQLQEKLNPHANTRVTELVLDAVPEGVILTDMNGRALYCNAAAEVALSRNACLLLKNGVLKAKNETTNAELSALFRRNSLGGTIFVRSDSSPICSLVLSVSPLPEPVDLRSMRGDPCLIVLIRSPEDSISSEPLASRLQHLFSLTSSEARAAALIGSGFDLMDAALRLGVTYETIRTVLKRVFLKMKVSRQGDLIMIVNNISNTLPHLRHVP